MDELEQQRQKRQEDQTRQEAARQEQRDQALYRKYPGLAAFESMFHEPPNKRDWVSDQDAIDHEHAFRKRFGRDFSWSDKDRVALFALKHRLKMTDDDARLFRRTGTLKRTAEGFKLAAKTRAAAAGGFLLAYLVLFFGAVLLAIFPQAWGSLDLGLKAGGLATGAALLCYAVYWISIKPWVRQRRLQRSQIVT